MTKPKSTSDRLAKVDQTIERNKVAVSYTHLDVYKRQLFAVLRQKADWSKRQRLCSFRIRFALANGS